MAGQIVKAIFDDPFARIPNDFLQNKKISARAKGVLSYILSLPHDWVIYKSYLHENFIEGRDAITKAFNELVKLGYIVEVQKVNPKTMRFDGYDYMVYATPFPENPKTEIPKTEIQGLPNKLKPNKQYTNTPIIPKGDTDKDINIDVSIKEWIDSYLRIHKANKVRCGYEDVDKAKLKRYYSRWLNIGRDPQEPLAALSNILRDDWQRQHRFPKAKLSSLFNIETVKTWRR